MLGPGTSSHSTGKRRQLNLRPARQPRTGGGLMAFTRFNSAEGGTNGTSATANNSGGVSGYAFDNFTGPAPTFSNTVAWSGSLSYAFTGTSSSIANWNLPGTNGTYYFRSWLYMNALPTAFQLYTHNLRGGTSSGASGVLTSGKLYCNVNSQGATGSYQMSAGAWYRIESKFTQGTGTSQGEVFLYDSTGQQRDHVITAGTGTVLGSTMSSFGMTAATTGTFYFDNLAVSDQGWIGSDDPFTLCEAEHGGRWHVRYHADGGELGWTVRRRGGYYRRNYYVDNTYAQSGTLSYKCATSSSYGR